MCRRSFGQAGLVIVQLIRQLLSGSPFVHDGGGLFPDPLEPFHAALSNGSPCLALKPSFIEALTALVVLFPVRFASLDAHWWSCSSLIFRLKRSSFLPYESSHPDSTTKKDRWPLVGKPLSQCPKLDI
jgi:hypothetical protein